MRQNRKVRSTTKAYGSTWLVVVLGVFVFGCGPTRDPELNRIIEEFGTEAKALARAERAVDVAIPKLERGQISRAEYSRLYEEVQKLDTAFKQRFLADLGPQQATVREGQLMVWARREEGLPVVRSSNARDAGPTRPRAPMPIKLLPAVVAAGLLMLRPQRRGESSGAYASPGREHELAPPPSLVQVSVPLQKYELELNTRIVLSETSGTEVSTTASTSGGPNTSLQVSSTSIRTGRVLVADAGGAQSQWQTRGEEVQVWPGHVLTGITVKGGSKAQLGQYNHQMSTLIPFPAAISELHTTSITVSLVAGAMAGAGTLGFLARGAGTDPRPQAVAGLALGLIVAAPTAMALRALLRAARDRRFNSRYVPGLREFLAEQKSHVEEIFASYRSEGGM